ncbi:MAG: GH3 auxin-responsive promoter family protein [Treponema sp.]|nr:GH3 auxin-responsive promoter family protein [Treponema sp.]
MIEIKKNRTKNAGLITFCLGFAGKAQKRVLDKAARNCRKTQEATLRSILEYARDTEWGKAHNFSDILAAKTDTELYSLWQKNVPPQDYEDLRPYIERHKNGEENILFPGKPMMYATTSGTTSKPKWIPVTDTYYKNVYSKMTKLWLYTFMMHKPHCFEGKALSVVGKCVEGYAPDGTVCGSISGVTRRDCPDFIAGLHSAPHPVFDIDDYAARYYAIIRIALGQTVSIIVTPNPSTILEMEKNINENFDRYVEDIEKGTLDKSLDIADDIRTAIEATLKPDPERARELRALKAELGTIGPKDFWPYLEVITTWKCGNTKAYVNKIKDSFSKDVLYQEFSYFASEVRSGLVMNGQDDTVLFAHMHYFEFVEESDLENPNPRYLQTSELEVGKKYCVYVTTFAGLYRYNMNDLVLVTGKYGDIPTIQFIQKINGIISMTGEKLSEVQFLEALSMAQKETGTKLTFNIGNANLEDSRYEFYFGFENPSITKQEADEFGALVDKMLCKVNQEYESKRGTNRIGAPVVKILIDDCMEQFKIRYIAAGMGREGQFKYNMLMQNLKVRALLETLLK